MLNRFSLLTLLCAALLFACGDDGGGSDGEPANNASANNGGDNNDGDNNGGDNNPTTNNAGNNNPTNNPTNNAGNNNPTNNNPTNNGVNNDGPVTRNYDLIRANPYPRLVLELDTVGGQAPRQAVRDGLVAKLEELLDKPGGVEWVDDEEIPSRGDDFAWDFAEFNGWADERFDLEVAEDTIKIHVLYVDGHSAKDTENGRILGQAWGYTHLIMYKETIDDLCERNAPPLISSEGFCASAELSIALHEVGHLLGLVDNGLPMVNDHRDPNADHGRHDADEDCLMYWAFEGQAMFDSLATSFLGGNEGPKEFGDNCLEDIAAVRDGQ